MPFGYYGKVLHINLTDNNWDIEEPTEKWYRSYVTPPLVWTCSLPPLLQRFLLKTS